MRCARTTLLVLALLALAGCERNSSGGIFLHTAWDLLWGEPDAEALAPSRRFDEAGIAFDYPALLRRREETDDDGSRSWSLEHGMFELQLEARPDALSAADLLGTLGGMFEGGRSLDAEGPMPGRVASMCGQRLTALRLRLKIAGDWSELEGFDLPAPAGESRLLLFDDEPVGDRPSAVARATYERVLGSLRCDPAFIPAPVETPGTAE
jgi:hypothetical protein